MPTPDSSYAMAPNTGALILLVATIYDSPAAALGELARNSFEADAKTCWIEFLPDGINVYDDGHGMTDRIKRADRAKIKNFEHQQIEGTVPAGYNLLDHVSQFSKTTVEWYWTKFGYSPKMVNGIQTNLGVGSKAVYCCAREATVYTKPTPKLAKGNWGEIAGRIPLLRVALPSVDDLVNNRVSLARPERLDEALVGPLGNVIEHGTMIQMRNLIATDIRPLAFAAYYANRFADVLRDGRRLILIDKSTADGRTMAERGEPRVIEVSPPTYQGRMLVDDRFEIGGQTCRIVIYHNSEKKASTLQIRRQGENVSPLTVLEAFQEGVWLQSLDGYVEFPIFTRNSHLWNPTKTVPLDTSTRAAWIKKIKLYESTLQQGVAEGVEQQSAKLIRQASKGLHAALMSAMQDLPAFAEFVPPPLEPVQVPVNRPARPTPKLDPTNLAERQTPKTNDQEPKTKNNIGIKVTSSNKGVPNVKIQLRLPSGELAELSTDSWGRALFSSPLAGQFTVSLIDVVVDESISPSVRTVTLPSTTIQWVHFELPNESEEDMAQLPPSIADFGVFEMPMGPGKIYQTRMAAGQIVINSDHPHLLLASSTGDQELVKFMLANRYAAAIANALLRGDAEFITGQAVELADIAMLRSHKK